MSVTDCGYGTAATKSAAERWERVDGDCLPNQASRRPSATHIREVLHGLACSVSSSERQFEQHCRQVAEVTGIPHYSLRRQTIRDAAVHALSAQNLGAIHALCGVRFGSLVWELMGIDLNAIASWHAAAYPDQTIRLPDYLWNPEFTFRCPAALDPQAAPAINSAVGPLVQEWTDLPLGTAAEAGSTNQVYRIGERSMQPLLHPGDLVLVQPNRQTNAERYEEGHRPRPVMVSSQGRYHACWTRPDLKAGQVIGNVLAFCKDLRQTVPRVPAVACGPIHRR